MLLLHATLLIYAAANVFSKAAGIRLAAQEQAGTLLYIALEFVTLGAYALLWQQTLKRMPLSFAYSNKGVCTLWTCLFGLIFFGETLTWGKAIGILVVLVGVCVVATEHE